jgi:hypothetical protein
MFSNKKRLNIEDYEKVLNKNFYIIHLNNK